ncbi:MAG: 2-iminoacetate synthase ThiH [Firmicutes bacterium HGW-Firmicutes-14]|nr:MAG: 2-iminoacetate synthase ThiH [Firmicutes bacterium HGW-Firmicutes-14]
MEFYDLYRKQLGHDLDSFLAGITPGEVSDIINKNRITETGFLALLSPAGQKMLEPMARKAHGLTVKNFGKVIQLYTPMYLSNHCTNECAYCGFNVRNTLGRRTLTIGEVEEEGRIITKTGLRHILVLTGESPRNAPVEYIGKCVRKLRQYFSSVSIEIYPLHTDEYKTLIEAGVDGLTLYQEVYDPEIYDIVHIRGPKKDYTFRLNAPERACRAGMRTVNLGALLGLNDWQKEVFALGLHARYLQDKYPETEISVSFPRIRPAQGGFQPKVTVSDEELVQMILAVRIFLPRVGITVSTRERADFRDNLIRLGVTKMSAGSCTEVGGRLGGEGRDSQFEISDSRSVPEMRSTIQKLGYQAVCKDWLTI